MQRRRVGLGDDHDGIIELPDSFELGTDLVDALQLDDVIVDVDLTPNRGDCLGLKGLAREVGVLNDLPVSYPTIDAVPATVDDTFPVTLSSPEGCPRYLGRVIRGVDLRRGTPLWMQERLRRCGLRSIDPVVDITNFVMIEQGQPMHAFDLRQLNERIDVRMARAGEKLTLLDGQEVELDTDTLAITDAGGVVAMAGVMGGERSGVQADTTDVFLECAFFAPLAIAGTARRYGLHTDASHRYERGVDWQLQQAAVERATRLLLEIVGGEAGPCQEAVVPEALPSSHDVTLRASRLQQLLGVDIDDATVDAAFARLGFELVDRSHDDDTRWTIRSPSHRFDIAMEADLVEEICRIYGYNNVPVTSAVTQLELRHVALERRGESQLKAFMADLGFQELITYTFVDPRLQDLLGSGIEPLALANPMSREQSVMRTNLLPGLIDAALANQARQQDSVRLFEVGLSFVPSQSGLAQTSTLAGLLWGRRETESWLADGERVDFYDIKGAVDRLFAWSGADVSYVRAEDGVLHPGQSALVKMGAQTVGRLGRLHPEIEATLDIEGVYAFELDVDAVVNAPRRVHTTQSRYPSVRRDLAIVVTRETPAAVIESRVRDTLGEILVDFTLFDVYEGKGIDSTEKSLGLGLTLQSQDATLTEDDIGRHVEAALAALSNEFGARLR